MYLHAEHPIAGVNGRKSRIILDGKKLALFGSLGFSRQTLAHTYTEDIQYIQFGMRRNNRHPIPSRERITPTTPHILWTRPTMALIHTYAGRVRLMD